MIDTVKKLWSPGTSGNPLRMRRQIALCNQVGLLGTAATVPYQLFYYFHDLVFYRGVFIANLLFMAAYLLVLLLNHAGRHNTASNVLLINACCQLFVVTCFIGAEAGVNLFYFTLASILAFLYQRLRIRVYATIMTSFGALYVVSYVWFTPDTALTPVPSPWIDIMYVVSVSGALTLSGVFLYLFRQQIDDAEDELTLINRDLETLSNTDPLTGLANRRVLDAKLEREWSRLLRRQQALSVIMFDVDHFKLFNDRYGHAGGDRCLQQIATASKKVTLRPSDLLARYGGEEFAVVLPGTDEAGARLMGERLRSAVADLKLPNESLGKKACVTISVGVSSLENMAFDADEHGVVHLLKCADEALYQAKSNGRDQVAYQAYDSTVSGRGSHDRPNGSPALYDSGRVRSL
ncbi:diguanylate cyclase (GGDEF) domain-containing protein [Kushneria avicenniae]|uniref:diguanylate cyclase n=1 Tax=Kushneria avicenniae TaxID=402385 RepID=A0A1I1KLQ4_9GAMM|nr:diguanylate cyclase [Kushneria avicenniae]SFC61914.1 diguanylate cyclase (GGDEF) domain-containing protein [Kushneria avicenniae]